MLIRDLVNVDNHGAFVPAVQLQDFDEPKKNLGLIRSFIFTAHAPRRAGLAATYYSSLELLVKFKETYMTRADNVIMLIADYGHGKSHLGLQAMNYFSQKVESEEFAALMERVESVADRGGSTANDLRNFRTNRAPFLVLHMSGDADKSIREMFYTALLKELRRHNAIDGLQLPFWNENAKRWLKEHENDPVVIAELGEKHGMDVSVLIQEVDKNRDGAWDKYVDVFKKVNHGNAPSSTDHKNPQEMIDWVMATLVGEGKPFSGLSVFFDEFSQFIRLYTTKGNDLDLPELLQGIGDHPGKALLLLLGHHDPDKTIQEATTNPIRLDAMRRHLTRIHKKWNLFTVVESVLDSFLANSRPAWETLKRESPTAVGGILGTTAYDAYEYFRKRYNDELLWEYEQYQEVVVKGCFPLHPSTTALLSSITFRSLSVSDARSMLKFVRDVYDKRKDMPILENSKINWVLPIELVDFFGDTLTTDDLYGQYQAATSSLRRILGDNATVEDESILKALLLQSVARYERLRGTHQKDLISHFSGLGSAVTSERLRELENKNIIDVDHVSKQYTFKVVSAGADVNQEIDRLASQKTLDLNTSNKLSAKLDASYLVPSYSPLEITVDWGNSGEWTVKQFVCTRANFNAETLRGLVPPFAFRPSSPTLNHKGALLWCISANEADRDYFREETGKIMAESFSDKNAPAIMVITPDQPAATLVRAFFLAETAGDMLVSPDMVQRYSDQAIKKEKDRLELRLKRELLNLFVNLRLSDQVNQDFFFPSAYTASFTTLDARNRSFSAIFQRLFKLAYPIAPRAFFTDLKGFGSTNLNASVKKIGAYLAMNNLRLLMVDGSPSVVDKRLVNDFLNPGWGVVAAKTYSISEPKDANLLRVWNEMNAHFEIGQTEVKVGLFLQRLLNVPYGFDHNTAWLLFCAWLGFNRSSIKVYKGGRIVSVKALMDNMNTVRGTLVVNLNRFIVEDKLAISRADGGKVDLEVREAIARVNSGKMYDELEAKDDLAKLESFIDQPNDDESILDEAKNAYHALKQGFKDKQDYEEKWDRLRQRMDRTKQLEQMVALTQDIAELREPSLIASAYSIIALNEQLNKRIDDQISALVSRATTFTNIEDAGLIREELKQAGEAVKANTERVKKVQQCQRDFEAHAKSLVGPVDVRILKEQLVAYSSGNQSLVTARNNRLKIVQLNIPDVLSADKSRALDILQTAIKNLEEFAHRSMDVYTKIEQKDLYAFRNQVLAKNFQYTGSELEADFDKITDYIDQLEGYFGAVGQIRNERTEGYANLSRKLESTDKLIKNYEAVLSSDHMIAANMLREEVERALDAVAQKAEAALVALEGILATEADRVSGTLDVQRTANGLRAIENVDVIAFRTRVEKAKKTLEHIKSVMDSEHAKEQIIKLYKNLSANEKEIVLRELQNL